MTIRDIANPAAVSPETGHDDARWGTTIRTAISRSSVRRAMGASLAVLGLTLTACTTTESDSSATDAAVAAESSAVDDAASTDTTAAADTTDVTDATVADSNSNSNSNSTGDDSDNGVVVETVSFAGLATIDDTHADGNDGDYDLAEATTIALADGSSAVSGDGATVDGDIVSITEPGTYVLSGVLSDGQVVVDSTADGKVLLVLDGADITSTSTSPIVFTAADEAVVVLADGSVNNLSDAAASGADDDVEDAPTATLFSMADLTIAGSGSLNVTGASNDAIGSKDGLVVLSGTLDIDAVDDGIRGKDYVYLAGGVIDVTSGGDGVKSDNDTVDEYGWVQIEAGTLTVSAGAQGVDGYGAVTIIGGEVDVTDSNEGLQAMAITMAGGTVDLVATDDGLNATAHTADGGAEDVEEGVVFTMTGGTMTVVAGSDGLDSNGVATVTGGTLAIAGANSNGGNGALDVNGDLTAPAVLAIDGTGIVAGDLVVVTNSSGDTIGSFIAPDTAGAWTVVAADLSIGETYTVLAGAGSPDTGTDGLEQVTTVTATDASDSVASGGGGGGGGRGNRP